MASVILPTVRWTGAADTVVRALRDGDELLVTCDSADDPVAADAPARAEVVVAGEPEGCAGKAHALAVGIERADDDIVVWTDDDVARDEGWLDRLVARAREHGAATEVPVFVGRGLWPLLEPTFAVFGTAGTAYGGYVWGGGVAFDRTTIDEAAFLADLRRTVGDDTLLSEYLGDPWADTERPRRVRVDGSPRAIYHRVARFAKAAFHFDRAGTAGLLAVLFGFAAGSVAFPLPAALLATLLCVAVYADLGIRRASALLAFPSFVVAPFVLAVGILAPTFRWGGRTYAWRSAFDVVVDL